MSKFYTYTIAIPAYNRPVELAQLLDSLLALDAAPDHVLICEDNSPSRKKISDVANEYKSIFLDSGVNFTYIENDINLGYDRNLRKLFDVAETEYVILVGDDDKIYPNYITNVDNFLQKNKVSFISRAFTRFNNHTGSVINDTILSFEDRIYNPNNSDSSTIFRLCGFVSGLVIERKMATLNSTKKFDGGLYYQYYLACVAYQTTGIGYISTPSIYARAGNPPQFGSATTELTHIPGSYTPQGRLSMWKSLLDISNFIDSKYNSSISNSIKHELMNRQCFHVFEMMPLQGRGNTLKLFIGLYKMGLGLSTFTITLFITVLIFGEFSSTFFSIIRKFQYLLEANRKFKV